MRTRNSNRGCKVCGTVYRKHATERSKLPVAWKKRGQKKRPRPFPWRGKGPKPPKVNKSMEMSCPNESKHEEILQSKARLANLLADDGLGLDEVGSDMLSCRIQEARGRLRRKWLEQNGHATMSETGELEETWE